MDHRLLPSLPETVEGAADPDCPVCHGVGWVCENHPGRVWGGISTDPKSCECGAGSPCRCTGLS